MQDADDLANGERDYCCERFKDMINTFLIREEKHSDQDLRYFVHLQAFYEAPFMHASTRLKFCPFCGAKL